ncbi:ABC transporter permease [Desulfatitalea alkaliphila]|uniref:ABC transporter permease n=1 Tax=Desulfatitalea alkaliphila TaxID=2929485 RepID=A0AA41UJS1_9BACT|nr:ABC transporter permease [Desulfatitalea alkaliphila]MCJ8499591.1 ABC transporter permease [Desulfatitalea alkaliphila]
MTAKRMLPLLAVLLAWQAMSSAGFIPAYKLPSPLEVLRGLRDLITLGMPPGHQLAGHAYHSLLRVFWGYLIAAGVAIPLGIVMGWSRMLNAALDPIIEMVRPIPPLAWIPIAILWFGIGNQSAAFIIFLGAFFPILLNTVNGVRTIDPILIEAARTLNASRRFILLKVLLPGAFPSIFTGLRIGLGIGWMTLVAAEFTGVRQGYGLGYMIMTARDIQRPDQIVAGMVVIGAIGFTIDAGLHLLERVLLRWR